MAECAPPASAYVSLDMFFTLTMTALAGMLQSVRWPR